MIDKKKVLFLFTAQYPYGKGENFIENELKILSTRFERIYIYPLDLNGSARLLPDENIEVVNWKSAYKYNGFRTLFKNLILFVRIYFPEFYFTSSKMFFLKKHAELRSLLLQNIERASIVNNFIERQKTKHAVFYAYWFSDWATILAILKFKKKIQSFYSRAHRFDLYEEGASQGFIPFRYFQMKLVNEIFSISSHGQQYLIKKFPEYKNKIKLSYLGVFDHGENPFSLQKNFTLVSCSNLIAVKRVHLIIEILKYVPIDLNWIHFGDGELKHELTQKASELPDNINVKFMGYRANDEIIEFYKKTPVHLFISTSDSEGLPVSLQEAISFGIPAIATNVGGVSEIINKHTGFLIEREFEVKQISNLLVDFNLNRKNSIVFRKEVKNYWEKKFNAHVNYSTFYEQLTRN